MKAIAIQNPFLRKIEFPFEGIRSGFSGCRESAAKLCTAGVAILFSDLVTCLSLCVLFHYEAEPGGDSRFRD